MSPRLWAEAAIRVAEHRHYRAIPRYFFDIHSGIHVIDDIGQDHPDLEAAKAEAIRIAGGLATRPNMLGGDGGVLVLGVRSGPDGTMMTVRLVFESRVDGPWSAAEPDRPGEA